MVGFNRGAADLEDYVQAFRANHIDAEVLPQLTAEDLIALGITSVGHRRKLLHAIAELDQGAALSTVQPAARTVRALEAERRQLTVLFGDLVGLTELAARLDPEDLREVMRVYQAACVEVVGRLEGHVARFLGGVLAYFGWPRAHEDDAERAVRAGLELIESMARLEPHAGVRLQGRIGIATGQVVVGDLVGAGASRDEAVVGEVPNLAARLQRLAAPGAVVISQATRRLLGGLFELDDLGPQRLKGFAEPLVAWRVAGPGSAEGRFEARRSAGLTPLVGRAEEIALLLHRWRQACDGEGQVVLLSGEPGIGKSRLIRELRERIAGEPHIRLIHQCSSYHQTSPLHPVIARLERAAGFARDDPPEARLDKLETLLAHGTERLDRAVPLIATLLGIPTGGRYPTLDLTPQRQKQLMLEALLDQLVALAAEQPVLAVYEDIHWMDPTTQALLGLVIERARRLPVLTIVTFRPEFKPPWAGQPNVSALALTRLDRRESAAMVERIVGAKALPAEVATQIVAKADGVPLFVEELTKTVLESGLLADAGDHYELAGPLRPPAIPATLHDSLMARLDRLAPGKEIAQIGAALGREFPYALLAAIADRPDTELRAGLEQLVSSGLVFQRGAFPEASFKFKHALVRDAAYGTLLRSRRQHLHLRIAEVLEKRFPALGEAQPELLAHHFTQAGIAEKAIDYWLKAGERACSRSAHREAICHLRQGLSLIATLPDGPGRVWQELRLQSSLGPALLATVGYAAPAVEEAYRRVRELCWACNRPKHLFGAMRGLFLVYLVRGELDRAIEVASEIVELAQKQENLMPRVMGHSLGMALFYSGDFSESLAHLEQGVSLYREHGDARSTPLYGIDIGVTCPPIYAARVWLFLGYPDKALMNVREGLALVRHASHAYSLAHALDLGCCGTSPSWGGNCREGTS